MKGLKKSSRLRSGVSSDNIATAPKNVALRPSISISRPFQTLRIHDVTKFS